MPSGNLDFNIAKNIRIIEWLKAEIILCLGALFKASIKNDKDAISDAMARMVTDCYFLGKRLGINYAELDDRIAERLEAPLMHEHELEDWYGDVTTLQKYIDERNRIR